MSNLKKSLETQQKINEAAKKIMDYFTVEMPYEFHLEQMLDAQTQILGLMELAKTQMIITGGKDELELETDEITMFLRFVRHYLQMLKPFVELAEERNDNKTE